MLHENFNDLPYSQSVSDKDNFQANATARNAFGVLVELEVATRGSILYWNFRDCK